ncbi:hypothetical protein AAFF_G00031130 [Aldrovandia affinis]|uniref:Density-regulated protein n=1 Tax=Aldrovandia affinis TaxID=143900 RepID=A0AAD7S4I7_9TELE|nr:hypothetical protein AAFF_G00031130 [Aldrovandia affinis]
MNASVTESERTPNESCQKREHNIKFVFTGFHIMATTENDVSGSTESKVKLRTDVSDIKYPLKVLYCGVCSLPTEYCEYMPEPTKCRQWLEKNFPDVFAKMIIGNTQKQETGDGEAGPAVEEEEKKKQKRGGRGQIKQKKKTVPQKITIAKIPRAKKKYVTRVCGMATFDIDLKEAQRFFAQKFSCGASVTAEDEIIIQGDFTDDIIDVIQEKWPEVDDDTIDDLGEVKK